MLHDSFVDGVALRCMRPCDAWDCEGQQPILILTTHASYDGSRFVKEAACIADLIGCRRMWRALIISQVRESLPGVATLPPLAAGVRCVRLKSAGAQGHL